MTDLLKNFKNGRMFVTIIAVLVGYGVTGGMYLKSVDNSIADIKEIRSQFDEHKILVLTQLSVLTTEIKGIRRDLTNLRRASRGVDRRKERTNNIPIYPERGL